MPAQENKAMIREFLHALSGKPKPAAMVRQYIAEQDEALRRHILHYETAFPCFELIAQDILAMGNCVLARLCLRGIHAGDLWSLPPVGMQVAAPLRPTHTGEFTGVPATGKQVVLPMTILYRVSKGTIAEHRMLYDADDLLRQLGFSPQWPHDAARMSERHGRRIPLWREIA